MVVQRRACRFKAYMRLGVLFEQETTSASIANEALMSQNREKGINVCLPRKRMSVRKAENLCVFAYFKIWRIIKRCFFSINNIRKIILEGVLILRNISLKLKMVVDNAILLNCAVSSENISESIKIKTENGFHLKVNVCKFRRNKNCPGKTVAPQIFIYQLCKVSNLKKNKGNGH